MQVSDFDYVLPEALIAQSPAPTRSASRLLDLTGEKRVDSTMRDFAERIAPGDLVVFNDTRVIPARVFGAKETGGRIELMVERVVDDRTFWAQVRASKAPRPGVRIRVGERTRCELEVTGRDDDLFHLRYDGSGTVMQLLEEAGQLPLPPYIQHQPDAADAERYQTVFAQKAGAVAAPTAGLHFDNALLAAIDARGGRRMTLTLHVGAGTFQPVRGDSIEGHRMHSECYCVDEALAQAIEATRTRGGRVIAVGTTVARALESAAIRALDAGQSGRVATGWSDTRLFITPGFEFRVVDVLLTNFHLPRSTLLMLVSAFGGYERLREAYRHAVEMRYRFFSYGDAMLIDRRSEI